MFVPHKIIFLKNSLNYEMGKDVYNFFKDNSRVEMIFDESNSVRSYFDQSLYSTFYNEGKRTLVLSVKQIGVFQTCKPSADYQLPLVSGCMGKCEYCYLHTQLKNNPFIKVNVNLESILEKAADYIKDNSEKITYFEGAATSDVLPLEPYTKILSKTIAFFANQPNARFRFVSKFNDVENLLKINHNNHTEIRFSINTDYVIKTYEHLTPSAAKRIEAAKKVIEAGYRVGFLIAPVFLYDDYKNDYYDLIKYLSVEMGKFQKNLSFEIISHRYTTRAKETIQEIFPTSQLEMDDESRTLRMGQFGYRKYVYTTDQLKEMKEFFKKTLNEYFPESDILYII